MLLSVSVGQALPIVFKQLDSKNTPLNTRIYSMALGPQGFLWLASGANLWRYDGYKLKSFNFIFNHPIKQIKKIYFDISGVLWVGTTNNGLHRYAIDTQSFTADGSDHSLASNFVSALVDGNKGDLWIGTDKGLNHLSSQHDIDFFPFVNDEGESFELYVTAIFNLSEQYLLVGTKKGLYRFHKNKQKFEKVQLINDDDFIVFNIYQDFEKNIWVATQKGVFRQKVTQDFKAFMPEIFDHSIPAISIDEDNIWIGSFIEGLYRVSQKNNDLEQYTYRSDDNKSISNDNVISITSQAGGHMWINTYSGGLNYFNINALKFGLENNSLNSIRCSQSREFNDFDHFDGFLWVSSTSGLIKLSKSEGGLTESCQLYQIDEQQNNVFTDKSLRSMTFSSSGEGWLATTKGLNKFDRITGLIDTSYEDLIGDDVFFIHEQSANKFLIGTIKGLYLFNPETRQISVPENTQEELKKAKIYWYVKGKDALYFATNVGIALYNQDGFFINDDMQRQLPTTEILSLYMNDQEELWVGTSLNGLFHFDADGQMLHHQQYQLPSNMSIYSIIASDEYLWMGTTDGLVSLDLNTNKTHVFREEDGLQGAHFDINAAYNGIDDKLYFGGLNGFNAFYADGITVNHQAVPIALTDFTRFGKSVIVGENNDGFVLKKDINALSHLTLGYKDYVVGFEFAALDYVNVHRYKYAYMLEGLDPDWIEVSADDRKISYSNLKAGDYVFRVKIINQDGVMSSQGKSLNIKVLPAPWLSWWAYILYALSALALIIWLINRKNKANDKITQLLRTEVAKQTQQLKTQKQQVESLLTRKNELFANVSHEFRTPLTLILGPINELLKSHLPLKDISQLKMVHRNANRLLTMIEQLLQLAKTVDDENISFHTVKTKPIIASIVQAFLPLAANKKIDMQLLNNPDVAICCTQDALEIILGNLLSNAIKYTPIGGGVSINVLHVEQRLQICVKDTGCGLSPEQQKEIFNRFTRLDGHHNIAGIGIGLSVVEEVLKINKGVIEIKSKRGEGSEFIFSLNANDQHMENCDGQADSDSLLLTQLTQEGFLTDSVVANDDQVGQTGDKETVLVIEDNADMRSHIVQVLSRHYVCLQAINGQQGVALAIKQVPDVIICDVMMPEMDGFHVSRIVRSDDRTSHIPLILLTALEDKASRIRGLREHVDAYLTKPFDAGELLLQLENILVIRNILKQKAGQNIKVGEQSCHSDLTKKDQQFIERLNQLIMKKYGDPAYLRPQMAADMAISERQLQRKLKALIDKNPMDLLREHRLNQAAKMLKDGHMVSVTSDECGFNSVTYFSQCFKAQFGMPPKVYQKTGN